MPEVSKPIRCLLLRDTGKSDTHDKRLPLTPRYEELRLECAQKYVNTDMKMVILTDEASATLDWPDECEKSWVRKGQEHYSRFRRQQGGARAMIWARIVKN